MTWPAVEVLFWILAGSSTVGAPLPENSPQHLITKAPTATHSSWSLEGAQSADGMDLSSENMANLNADDKDSIHSETTTSFRHFSPASTDEDFQPSPFQSRRLKPPSTDNRSISFSKYAGRKHADVDHTTEAASSVKISGRPISKKPCTVATRTATDNADCHNNCTPISMSTVDSDDSFDEVFKITKRRVPSTPKIASVARGKQKSSCRWKGNTATVNVSPPFTTVPGHPDSSTTDFQADHGYSVRKRNRQEGKLL